MSQLRHHDSERVHINTKLAQCLIYLVPKLKVTFSSLPVLRASPGEFRNCKPFLFLLGMPVIVLEPASAPGTLTAWGPGGGPCGVSREGGCPLCLTVQSSLGPGYRYEGVTVGELVSEHRGQPAFQGT